MSYFTQKLNEGEVVVRVVRKHWVAVLKVVFKIALFLIIPFVFIKFLLGSWPGTIVFIVWIVLAVTYAVYEYIRWYFDSIIVTNQRIIDIDQKGLLHRDVSEAMLDKIQDVTYGLHGFLATSLNFGSVNIQTSAAQNVIELDYVPDPQKVQEIIVKLVDDYKNQKGEMTASELVEYIAQIKEKKVSGVDEPRKLKTEKGKAKKVKVKRVRKKKKK